MPKTYRFLIMTIDPVHVGTGGMRLGRVDNTIVREPGTKLPKIPGTALHGAIRAYAARRYGKTQCAGQGQIEKSNHCGRPTCPICYTFGYSKGSKNSFSGVVSISDARILLFPVYSMVGPVWVSTFELLEEAGFTVNDKNGIPLDKNTKLQKEEVYLTWDRTEKGTQQRTEGKAEENINSINLGWFMLEVAGKVSVELPKNLKEKVGNDAVRTWESIKDRIVLVPDNLFSQIVNSNLEVRTSIAINPETGAVEEGALFTYEAIPRATFLWFDVVVDDFRGSFPSKVVWDEFYKKIENASPPSEMPEDKTDSKDETEVEKVLRELGYIQERPKKEKKESDEEFAERKKKYWEKVHYSYKSLKEAMEKLDWKSPVEIVNLGLEWAEHLGIGGMGTRGFGRIKNLECWKVNEKVMVECKEENNESSRKS